MFQVYEKSLLNKKLKGDPKYCFRIKVIGNNTELSTSDVEYVVNSAIMSLTGEDDLAPDVREKLEPVYEMMILNRVYTKRNAEVPFWSSYHGSNLLAKVDYVQNLWTRKGKHRVTSNLTIVDVIDACKAFSASELLSFTTDKGLVLPGSVVGPIVSDLFAAYGQDEEEYVTKQMANAVCGKSGIRTRPCTKEGMTVKDANDLENKMKKLKKEKLKIEKAKRTIREAQNALGALSRMNAKQSREELFDFCKRVKV